MCMLGAEISLNDVDNLCSYFGICLNCMHIIHILSSPRCGLCSDLKFVVYFFLKKKCGPVKSAYCLWSPTHHFSFEPNERFL
jgi:hypothetical protein